MACNCCCKECEGGSCCGLNYPREGGECCDGEWRMPDTGVCCGGVWHPLEETGQCCGGEWYSSEAEGECCGDVWRTEPGDCCVDVWYADGPLKCPEGQVFARFAGHGGYFPDGGYTGRECCGCFPEQIWDPRIEEFVNLLDVLEPTFDESVGIDITPCCDCEYGPHLPFVVEGDALHQQGWSVGSYIGCRGRVCYTSLPDLVDDNPVPPVCDVAYYPELIYLDPPFGVYLGGTPEGASISNTFDVGLCCGTCPQLCCIEDANGMGLCTSPYYLPFLGLADHPNPGSAGCPPPSTPTSSLRCDDGGRNAPACPGFCCIDGIPIEDLGYGGGNYRSWSFCSGPVRYYDPATDTVKDGVFQWAGLGSTECQLGCRQPFTADCCESVVSSGAGLTFTQPNYKRIPFKLKGGWRVTATGFTDSAILIHGTLFGQDADPVKRCPFSHTFDLCGEEFSVEPVPCGTDFWRLDIEVCWQPYDATEEETALPACDDIELALGGCGEPACVTTMTYSGSGRTSNAPLKIQSDSVIEANGTGPLVLTNWDRGVGFCPERKLTLSGSSGEDNEIQGLNEGAFWNLTELVKSGTGKWRISLSTFSADITVYDGTLEFVGAIGYTGSMSVLGGSAIVNQIVSGPAGVVSATFTASTLTVDFSLTPTSGSTYVLLPGAIAQSYTPVLTNAGGATGTFNSATSTLTIS